MPTIFCDHGGHFRKGGRHRCEQCDNLVTDMTSAGRSLASHSRHLLLILLQRHLLLHRPLNNLLRQCLSLRLMTMKSFFDCKLSQFSTTLHASTSGTSVLLTSRDSSWIIDSGASDLFTRLSNLSDIRSVVITNGRSCSVSGEGVVETTSQITLDKVLFVLDFRLICYPIVP